MFLVLNRVYSFGLIISDGRNHRQPQAALQ